MDFERNVNIGELYDLKHRHDNEPYNANDYKDNILSGSLSRALYKNEKTAGFLDLLEKMVSHMYTSNVVLRNWFNFSVDKYYDRHNN